LRAFLIRGHPTTGSCRRVMMIAVTGVAAGDHAESSNLQRVIGAMPPPRQPSRQFAQDRRLLKGNGEESRLRLVSRRCAAVPASPVPQNSHK
jgi:hypothetical protein